MHSNYLINPLLNAFILKTSSSTSKIQSSHTQVFLTSRLHFPRLFQTLNQNSRATRYHWRKCLSCSGRPTLFSTIPFSYTCWSNFGTMSATPSSDFEFDLEGEKSGKRSWSCKLLREARYCSRPFWYTCWRNFGTISVPRPLTQNLPGRSNVRSKIMIV